MIIVSSRTYLIDVFSLLLISQGKTSFVEMFFLHNLWNTLIKLDSPNVQYLINYILSLCNLNHGADVVKKLFIYNSWSTNGTTSEYPATIAWHWTGAPVVPQSCCNHEMKKICILWVNEHKASETIPPTGLHSHSRKKWILNGCKIIAPAVLHSHWGKIMKLQLWAHGL